MTYVIQNIGTVFDNKGIKELETKLNNASERGYRFHSVIEINQPPGCAAFGPPTVTYLAVFEATPGAQPLS